MRLFCCLLSVVFIGIPEVISGTIFCGNCDKNYIDFL